MDLLHPLLYYTFIGVTACNLIYYLFFSKFVFSRASREKEGDVSVKKKKRSASQPVSIVVCSKNEAENLRNNVPIWLAQKHDNFQLVLINDASRDDTKDIIEEFAALDKRVTVVNVENNETFWGSKKYALTLGIKRAEHNILIFTDADCIPNSPYWIQQMTDSFVDEKELVLGYGAYKKIKGSFLNSLIRYETVFTALQYFGYAKWGNAYMGVGRNLAYTSELFYEQKGFITHIDVQSGDDDLFVNTAATSQNTTLCTDSDAFTISEPKKSFGEWITQKRRHIHVSKYYKRKHRFLLGLFYLSQILFITLAILLLTVQYQWVFVTSIIGGRYLINWIIVARLAFKLEEKDVAFLYPFFELFLIIFQLGIFMSNLVAKPRRWK